MKYLYRLVYNIIIYYFILLYDFYYYFFLIFDSFVLFSDILFFRGGLITVDWIGWGVIFRPFWGPKRGSGESWGGAPPPPGDNDTEGVCQIIGGLDQSWGVPRGGPVTLIISIPKPPFLGQFLCPQVAGSNRGLKGLNTLSPPPRRPVPPKTPTKTPPKYPPFLHHF